MPCKMVRRYLPGRQITETILVTMSPPEKTYAYIQWLLKNGADPNIANTEGRMPAEIALFSEADQKIIDLLKENTNPKHADDHEQ